VAEGDEISGMIMTGDAAGPGEPVAGDARGGVLKPDAWLCGRSNGESLAGLRG
jgi:hypothetical protein